MKTIRRIYNLIEDLMILLIPIAVAIMTIFLIVMGDQRVAIVTGCFLLNMIHQEKCINFLKGRPTN